MNRDIYKLVESYMKDADEYSSDIQGLENYSIKEIKDIVRYYIKELLGDDIDIEIVDIFLCGSRIRQTARDDSDLDVKVFYNGNIKEDALFNILNDNDDRLVIDGVLVDMNPIWVSEDKEEQYKKINKVKEESKQYDKDILINA